MAARAADEVEIKIALSDQKSFVRRLKSAGFVLQTPRTLESNILYDFPDGRLRKRGELIRVRQYGRVWTVTFKGPGKTGRHKRREEIESKVEDGRALELMLIRLGMSRSFAYEKYRSEWTDGRGQVVVDETPIGTFAEIEGPAKWIDRTAVRLGISRDQYITGSYAELFAVWKRRTRSAAAEMTFAAVKPLKQRH